MQPGEKRRRQTTMDRTDHWGSPVRHVGTSGGSRNARPGRRLQGTFSGNAILSLMERIGSDLRDTTWMDQANCLDKDPEIFFPDHGGINSEARAICGACPVREECGEYGKNDEHGVWGGTSYRAKQKRGELDRGDCQGGCGARLQGSTTLAWCAWCDPDPMRAARRRAKILQSRARRAGQKSTATSRPSALEQTVAGIERGIKALGENATRPKLYARLAANRRPSFEQAMLQLEGRITEKDGVISLNGTD